MCKNVVLLAVWLLGWGCVADGDVAHVSDETLSLEERGRAIASAFNIRSSIVQDLAVAAPCELHRTLVQDARYGELVEGMRGRQDLPVGPSV